MERNARIKDFFTFLKENRHDENSIDLVIGKLGLEIQQERLVGNDWDWDKKEYLESLLEIKDGLLRDFLDMKRNGTRKEIALAFRKLIDVLVQDVRLHGLGTAQ